MDASGRFSLIFVQAVVDGPLNCRSLGHECYLLLLEIILRHPSQV